MNGGLGWRGLGEGGVWMGMGRWIVAVIVVEVAHGGEWIMLRGGKVRIGDEDVGKGSRRKVE